MMMLKERAFDIIRRMPEEKELFENTIEESKMPGRKALEDLERFRRRSDVEIDYKAELAKARAERYE